MTERIEKSEGLGDMKIKYLATIEGPEAAEILSRFDGDHMFEWKDKSIDGKPIVELWGETNDKDKKIDDLSFPVNAQTKDYSSLILE